MAAQIQGFSCCFDHLNAPHCCVGTVFLRGLTLEQQAVGAGSVIGTADPSTLNVTQLLLDTAARTAYDGVESSALQASTPKCSPVIFWSHNRIECFVVPDRAPEVRATRTCRLSQKCKVPLIATWFVCWLPSRILHRVVSRSVLGGHQPCRYTLGFSTRRRGPSILPRLQMSTY
jgi:hypothetical protein